MSDSDSKKCMLIGLPSSGKSSFIGAFWHVVLSAEIQSAFTVTYQPEDREYLNQLQNNFLECKAPERTKTGFEKKIELNIKDNVTEKVVDFIFPDLSGETYESQIEHRQLSVSYLNEISECDSIMLFVNPDFLREPQMISQTIDMLGADGQESSNNLGPQVKWAPKLCQTQISLIELLQFIETKIITPCNIGIIVSAWDVIANMPQIEKKETQPTEWLIARMPLLYQYLTANKRKFSYEVFGVSAQGGKYEEALDKMKMQSKIRQSERILVQVGSDTSHDITVPIKWLLNR